MSWRRVSFSSELPGAARVDDSTAGRRAAGVWAGKRAESRDGRQMGSWAAGAGRSDGISLKHSCAGSIFSGQIVLLWSGVEDPNSAGVLNIKKGLFTRILNRNTDKQQTGTKTIRHRTNRKTD